MISLKTYSYFLISGFLLLSCQQIKESYRETITPNPSPEEKEEIQNNTNRDITTVINSTSVELISSANRLEDRLNKRKKHGNFYQSGEHLDSIQGELMALFPGKKLMLYQSLYFYDFQGGTISINLQDPDKPKNIDNYTYSNGRWNAPNPVKITGNMDKEKLLFPMEKVKFSVAKKVHDQMKEAVKNVEGGVLSDFVYFHHIQTESFRNTIWYSSISGDREDLRLEFDLDGKEISRK